MLVDLTRDLQFENRYALEEQEQVTATKITEKNAEVKRYFNNLLSNVSNLSTIKSENDIYFDLIDKHIDLRYYEPKELDKDIYEVLCHKQWIDEVYYNNCECCGKELSFMEKIKPYNLCTRCDYNYTKDSLINTNLFKEENDDRRTIT